MQPDDTMKEMARTLVHRSIKAGGDEADAYVERLSKLSVSVKDGAVEDLQQSTSKGLGLRVFKDGKTAFSFTSDFSASATAKLVDETLALIKYTDSDPCHHLPETALCGRFDEDLDLYDKELADLDIEAKIDLAKRAEQAARDADARVTKFRSTRYADGRGSVHLVTSKGLELSNNETYAYVVSTPVAEENDEKRMGYWFTVARHFRDLLSPEEIGRIATERACAQLGAKPRPGGTFPVVFDPLSAARLLEWLSRALSGSLVHKRGTFLVDKLGEQIASPHVTVVEDATLPRGIGSAYFDGEGVRPWRKELVTKGILSSFLFDTYYACKTGNRPTANAQRSYDSTPRIATFNLFLEPGTKSPDEIVSSVESGLYITGLMGSGLDTPTGHFSVGVKGFWIENGQKIAPVSEMTAAGSLLDLLKGIIEVGNDLDPLDSTYAPTLLVEGLALSGKGVVQE